MAKLTHLPNEIILKIFEDQESHGESKYMSEFWYLPYLNRKFLPLCIEESAKLMTHPQDRGIQAAVTENEKLQYFKAQEARQVNRKFHRKIECRLYKKPLSMILPELRAVSLREEGIHRDPEVLNQAARWMADRQITRYPLLGANEPCCNSKPEPWSRIWHIKERVRLYILQKRVLWLWWLLDKKRRMAEWLIKYFREMLNSFVR